MRISAATVLLLTLLGLGSRPATAADASGGPLLRLAVRPAVRRVWPACGLSSEDLPSGLRGREGDENLLVRRMPGNLSADAGMSSPQRRVSAHAPVRNSQMREEAGREGIPSRGSPVQVRRAKPLLRVPGARIDRRPQHRAQPADAAGAVGLSTVTTTPHDSDEGPQIAAVGSKRRVESSPHGVELG